jgi:hypothetical protein
MSKLSPGENYLRLARGELPESVPIFTMGFPGYNGETACKLIGPSLLDETHITPAPEGRRDIWGVNYIANAETNYACIPEPNNFLLSDITKWRQVIKKPELPDHIDWERLAKQDCERAGLDRSQSAAMAVIGLMPFQQLIAFMGFTDGLLAFFEEPECVAELLDYMTELYEPVVRATVEHYKPDVLYLLDDTATNRNPFISPEMFRTFLKPIYKRLTQPAVDRGIPVQFHNCGRCEDFLDDLMDIGTKIWDPAQPANDLGAIQAKYGGRLALVGCDRQWTPDEALRAGEEAVRQAVRDCIDAYAPGGGFAFFSGGVMARSGDRTFDELNAWIREEAYNYCRDYYRK